MKAIFIITDFARKAYLHKDGSFFSAYGDENIDRLKHFKSYDEAFSFLPELTEGNVFQIEKVYIKF